MKRKLHYFFRMQLYDIIFRIHCISIWFTVHSLKLSYKSDCNLCFIENAVYKKLENIPAEVLVFSL